ncbi:MAG: hypothetical protein KatS3mg101_0495 [Patescibacteria group bacterium]|nr:MAG: hypothetical protein KatS3mg101_0495 [Patescibacteria group bacterium]
MSKRILDTLKKENIYISFSIVGDKEMRKLNKKHLGRDYPTDVLSFPINDKSEDGTYYLGDVVVNRDQAKRQAQKYGNDLEHEIADLAAHGVLHLLGVHHEGDGEVGEGSGR